MPSFFFDHVFLVRDERQWEQGFKYDNATVVCRMLVFYWELGFNHFQYS